ncbi:MAG: hypothetical protein RR543_03060 [Erysipelotrichales bacterium]
MKGKIIVTVALLLLICSCHKTKRPYLISISNGDNTNLISYDKDLNVLNENTLKESISIPSNKNIIQNNNLYDIKYSPKQNDIVSLNLDTFKLSNIKINNKENPQVFDYNNKLLVYSSNFLKNNSLNLVSNNNKEKSCIYENYFFNHIILKDNRLFAFITYNNKKEYLLEIDLNSLKIKKEILLKSTTSINSNPIINKDTIYFIDNTKKLNLYNMNTNKIEQVNIKLDSPAKMYLDQDNIYISNADNLQLTDIKPRINIYNIKKKTNKIIKLPFITYDFIVEDEYLYLFGQDKISKVNKKDFKEIKTVSLKPNQIPIKIIKAEE